MPAAPVLSLVILQPPLNSTVKAEPDFHRSRHHYWSGHSGAHWHHIRYSPG
jgi:hypothetical protein